MGYVNKSWSDRPSVKPFSVTSAQKLGLGEVRMDFSRIRVASPNFNLSVRAGRSFAIRDLNRVIKPLCGKLDICLATRLRPTIGCIVLFACFRSHIVVESERCCFWIVLFSHVLAQFRRLRDRNQFRSRTTRARGCTYYFIIIMHSLCIL